VVTRLSRGGWLALLAGFACVACEPNLDERTFLVTSAEVLAVQSVPAEAAPGGTVKLSTLYVNTNGAVSGGRFDWAFCDARNPLANLGPVSSACIAGPGGSEAGAVFTELGTAVTESGPVPLDACKLFGPDVPSALPNEPPGRPVDPDVTGGYYQPARLVAGGLIAIGVVRITCDIPGASPAEVSELAADSHPNQNPAIDAVSAGSFGTLVLAEAGTNTVQVSQRLDLEASWSACAPTAASCTGSEGYAYLDPQTHAVAQAREQIRVSWFATAGVFDDDRTGREPTDPTTYTDNGWTAPATPGRVNVWLVVRDDRGGVGWSSYTFTVKGS
jgi:hypothetical protein